MQITIPHGFTVAAELAGRAWVSAIADYCVLAGQRIIETCLPGRTDPSVIFIPAAILVLLADIGIIAIDAALVRASAVSGRTRNSIVNANTIVAVLVSIALSVVRAIHILFAHIVLTGKPVSTNGGLSFRSALNAGLSVQLTYGFVLVVIAVGIIQTPDTDFVSQVAD